MSRNNFIKRGALSRRAALLGALGGAASAWAPAARALPWPARPIQLVAAAPAGGPPDTLARLLAEDLGRILGQPVVVVNKPGGIGLVAAEHVARAAPDGHVLMLSWIGNATCSGLVPRASVDFNRDFVHITQLTAMANVLLVPAEGPIRSLDGLLHHARAHPGELAYASTGNGSSGHLAMEMLQRRAGVSLVHAAYRGAVPALQDLMSGEVDAMFINQDAVVHSLDSARVRPLAVSGATRHPLFPQVPTVAESGFPGFEASTWAGLSAPAGTPPPVIAAIHHAAVQALQGPLGSRYKAMGAHTVGSTPSSYQAFMRDEIRKWGSFIHASGLTLG